MLNRNFTKAENDALALISAAKALSSAYDKGSVEDLVQALDDNLTVWIAIRTFALDKKHTLAQETKNNLIKLSDFVASRTLKMAQNIDRKTLSTFVNNNLLIADGLLANVNLAPAQEDAFALINSSVHLANALNNGDKADLVTALDDNMQLWVAIKTMIAKRKNMPAEVKSNILKVADYMVASTLQMGKSFDEKKIETIINTNLQIAEGLLAGKKMSQAEEDAFALMSAAIALADAQESKKEEDLINALEENISLWVFIKALMSKERNPLAKDIRENLVRLSDFMVGKSIEIGKKFDYKGVTALVNANLQICEGLLERSGGVKTSDVKKKQLAAKKIASSTTAKKTAAVKSSGKKKK